MNVIVMLGGREAYAKLGEEFATSNPSIQHGAAHIFGGALYDVEGIKSFSSCDANFSYGCYHEFVGKAIRDKGLSSIAELNEGCLGTTGIPACQHGIGHGMLAYLGYDSDALKRSLSLCSLLEKNNIIAGCNGGVFMEYNLHTMLGALEPPRVVGTTGWLYPCNNLPEVDLKNTNLLEVSCARLLPQWWWSLSGISDAAQIPAKVLSSEDISIRKKIFVEMGQRCRSFVELHSKRACFEGIGEMAPVAGGYVPDSIALLCQDTSENRVENLLCVSLAANLLSNTGYVERGENLCANLPSKVFSVEDVGFCTAYAHGLATSDRPIALPK